MGIKILVSLDESLILEYGLGRCLLGRLHKHMGYNRLLFVDGSLQIPVELLVSRLKLVDLSLEFSSHFVDLFAVFLYLFYVSESVHFKVFSGSCFFGGSDPI